MISKRASHCLRLLRTQGPHVRSCRAYNGQRRLSSSSASGPAITPSPLQSAAAPIASITGDLDRLAPRFDLPADSIEILRSPSEFYEILKAKISTARKRIYLSTLYIGKSEHEFIATVHNALKSNRDLKVCVLTDALRGTREAPDPSCASLLAALVRDFGPDRVEIRMYHTPNLTGVRKAILPKRINEGWGLQHMKLYGIDDEIIMSGANLSSDYFTNRQDRYHLFKSKEVTDYFAKVHQTVCGMSYRIVPDPSSPSGFSQEWPTSNIQPSPLSNPKAFIASATRELAPLMTPQSRSSTAGDGDTSVYPLLQLTPLLKTDTSTELPGLMGILRRLSTAEFAGSKWTFTAGYFNMTPDVRDLLLQSRASSATVIAASPWANGFYGSKGISGMLPAAYTLLSRRFLKTVSKSGLGDRITLKEWRKGTVNTPEGWTYHAKGIWVTLPGEKAPSISLVGSSNYTKRSYSLDLEANTLIITRNPDLQRRLGEEEAWLQDYASPMKQDDYTRTDRRVGLHVRIAMWIVTLVGGAL